MHLHDISNKNIPHQLCTKSETFKFIQFAQSLLRYQE